MVHQNGWRVITALYFIAASILFFLPGSAIPKESWLDAIYADKIVHIGLFGVGSLLLKKAGIVRSGLALLAVLAAYGLMVEMIQGRWIPNRSFDWIDLLVDVAGAAAGTLIGARIAAKK
jgi:hypothetical protein